MPFEIWKVCNPSRKKPRLRKAITGEARREGEKEEMQAAREKGNEAFRRGDLDAALKHYEQALSYGVSSTALPTGVSAVRQKGRSKGPGTTTTTTTRAGQTDGAQLISSLIHSNMAAVYLIKGEHGKALECASRAVAIDPSFAKARRVHFALLRVGVYKGDDLLTRMHGMQAHYRRGKALSGLNRNEEAIEAYYRALHNTPESEEAVQNEIRASIQYTQFAVTSKVMIVLLRTCRRAPLMLVSSNTTPP